MQRFSGQPEPEHDGPGCIGHVHLPFGTIAELADNVARHVAADHRGFPARSGKVRELDAPRPARSGIYPVGYGKNMPA